MADPAQAPGAVEIDTYDVPDSNHGRPLNPRAIGSPEVLA